MYQTWLSFECVVGTWVSMLLFTEARTIGLGAPVFLYTSRVHAKCGGQNSQTIRVYAHTWNMTPSVSSVFSYQLLGAGLLCLQILYEFCTHFIFIWGS